MMDNDAPLTDDQRVALGQSALAKIQDGIAEYLLATKAEGDAETLSVGLVLYEATGIDARTSTLYTRTNFFLVNDTVAPTHALGVLEVAGQRLRDGAMYPSCNGGHA